MHSNGSRGENSRGVRKLNSMLEKTAEPLRQLPSVCRSISFLVFVILLLPFSGATQNLSAPLPETPLSQASGTEAEALTRWEGRVVRKIEFAGIPEQYLDQLPSHLAQTVGTPLNREQLRHSLRQLYATGLYDNISLEGQADGAGVTLLFRGVPRMFLGTITVDGAKGASMNTQLARATQLNAGARFTHAQLDQAIELMQATLANNGFHEPKITWKLTPHPETRLMDVAFQVTNGPQARVDKVQIEGDPGMKSEEFLHHAHLKAGAKVDHETSNRALSGVLKQYQKREQLEAEIKLESQNYSTETKKTSYIFYASQGPVVRLRLDGASIPSERLRHLLPIFEEGAVDDDLLNEGNRRLRDYFQRLGYFDVSVEHERQTPTTDMVTIIYHITPGPKHKVLRVGLDGNHYFSKAPLQDLLSVRAAGKLDHHGLYSQSLVAADAAALQSVYQNNGFTNVKIVPETTLAQTSGSNGKKSGKPAPLLVTYHITEGEQVHVSSVRIEGVEHGSVEHMLAQMNTTAGQLLSPQNLSGDRDALLTDFLSRGFDQARVDVLQIPTTDPNRIDVLFRVHEGRQIFVRNILLTGLHYTRPDTVAKAITLHPGDPFNETALAETQRNLYDFALFNEINTAVENPTGSTAYKTILLQTTEARRWVLTYGAGFEMQTGTPQNNCANAGISASRCNPNGTTGISVRGVLDITRNNLGGRERSASLRGTYGLLEQKVDLLFQNPHFHGNRNLGLTLSGGYANSRDISTYVSSRLEENIRFSEHFRNSRANTLIYDMDFRRVKVAASSLQVWSDEIAELSTAVRVTGPGLSWVHDTRDSQLDAHSGTYTSFQEFFSTKALSAQAQFNRIDISNSNFFSFDKGRFVLARNTRYGQERAFGSGSEKLLPLPERLYAGGATSHRGFGQNAAGPRDPVTGYPIGGAGTLTNSTELRLPPPTLPWIGSAVSFVLFHDMGNVFTNAGDAWASALRIHQPDMASCRTLTSPTSSTPWNSTGVKGSCNFNYFSHTPGLGLRYHTPVGPIRLDFSYNLNPPIYPAIQDYTNTSAAPHVGQAQHFNFFFSLGQTF